MTKYVEELIAIIRGNLSREELIDRLFDYHDNDIAEALELLTPEERKRLYSALGAERVAEIFAYLDDGDIYLKELSLKQQAKVISEMDSDDAVDILEEVDDDTKCKILGMLDKEASEDVRLLLSYDEDEIGSYMTTNFILIHNDLTVREAMRELVRQAGENDNISTIYVVDRQEQYYGAIELQDLIIAREHVELEDLISRSYPFVMDHEKISDCIEKIKDYAEDSIPVLLEDRSIGGIITAQDIVEVVDDEMGDDYAKLAGLTAEEDLNETTGESIRKRLPWLVILLFLGMVVSAVVGVFESVVAVLPIVMCFQSLILDMAGNVGTQSLAVTIRVLMDENLTTGQKVKLMFKEMKIGFFNGAILAVMALVFLGAYIHLFKGFTLGYSLMISACVGVSLVGAMVVSSLVGTLTPIFFKKVGVDPAVASGPLITTINDLVAIVVYYGLVAVVLIDIVHLV
ncbi:magnesium transporter [Laedolimicola ammoniilytica]|uniref:Magnesium transporter MgtE n=1 Tax=Laedolimicola ammoniilytica TaxID=2981771 RepID=A0ABT2RTV5_9FIRM|nr:magnesium transporter [Laedolimicola ammoniilytica]MCU6695748.1 magnesium transporter [Laedolimicola ammoniilytica]SCH17675.1 Magnesium transporter mgtE [uncultured Clostridium sp.]